jgi:demethylmenaquinone methyltransferase/2-methoxy-6-polyprenyl-1,4-benzoquinol methylase
MANRYVAGSSTAVSRTDEHGNTYQRQRLPDGSDCEILKNFPTRMELHACLGQVAEQVEIRKLPYYWYAECVSRAA